MASGPPKWWEQVDFKTASLHMRRAKNGTPATHPLSGRGREMRELRRISGRARCRRSCLSRNVARRYRRQGSLARSSAQPPGADLGIKAHAHMHRHACGYKLANDGHDTRAIQPTLGIATSRIRPAIPPWRRSGLRNFFEIRGSS
jgi:Phage integrase family